MQRADVYARLRRLQALSAGFKAELETAYRELLPFYPVETLDYSKAIDEAQQAIERARGALQRVVDKIEEVRRRGWWPSSLAEVRRSINARKGSCACCGSLPRRWRQPDKFPNETAFKLNRLCPARQVSAHV